ncbi:MAG: hypothetical protein PWP24_1248 [Clostridiales bacterium]|nr:hypothetical protein [Clostridiales bacterium]
MTCMDTQRNMKAFVEETLDLSSLEDFLHHIHTCASCREDVEVYFAIFSSIRLLEEDKMELDPIDFNRFLRRAEEKVRRKHRWILYKKLVIVAIMIVISILLEK